MIPSSAIDQLQRHLSAGASALTPASAGYDQARLVVNRRFDKRPAVLVRCATTDDAALAVRFAREQGVPLSIRSGGCSPAGYSSNDGGVVIDLSPMHVMTLDPVRMRARVGPGTVLEQVYSQLSTTDLMVVTGECKPVGVGGVTLGGGFGLLSRSLGLACDNLLEATMVTADGTVRTVSAAQEPDLFWAIRGGGCNFGVVTSLDLALHRLLPTVYCATVVWPIASAATVLTEALAYFSAEAPDEMDAVFAFASESKAGGTPENSLVMIACYNGPPEAGKREMDRLIGIAKPASNTSGPQSYAALVAADFPMPVESVHDYFKSGFVTGPMPREAIELLVERFNAAPQNGSAIRNMVFFELAGGAINRVAPDATAFVHRTHSTLLSLCATWEGATGTEDPAEKAWADGVHREMEPWFSGGVYQNYPDAGLVDHATAYYGSNLPRLRELKRRYDPANVFGYAQGIPVG